MNYSDTAILIFAKAPVEGNVNTRLGADIGMLEAARLQEELIHDRLAMLQSSGLNNCVLKCLPDSQHETFLSCEKKYSITLSVQTGENLGERMLNGIVEALDDCRYCIVIGTDAPALDAENIKQAIMALRLGNEVVFVPAEDGGYVLIGMSKPYAFLFQGIDWGSAQVMQQSREKLASENISYKELTACWDIDRFEDYLRYQKTKHASDD